MTEAKDMIHDIFDKSGLRTEYGCVIGKDDLASFFCGSVIDPLDRFEVDPHALVCFEKNMGRTCKHRHVLFDMDMVAERFDPSFKRGAEMKAHLVEKGSDRRKGKRTFV